jgi:outer membrane protein OmpU
MNKFKKIGLSALAGSLVAFSAQDGEMSVSGSASLTFSNADDKSLTNENNQWTMGDSLTFTGSGELDNGMTISVSYELDGQGGATDAFDDHSMSLDTNGMGTITFSGHGGTSAMGTIDDTTPNAYEESWDIVTGADTGTLVGGVSGENMFTYTSPDLGGATIKATYLNADDVATDTSYMDFVVIATPSMVDGLTVGFGMAETEETTGTVIDDQTMYASYTYGSVTVGYSMSESDGPNSSNDLDRKRNAAAKAAAALKAAASRKRKAAATRRRNAAKKAAPKRKAAKKKAAPKRKAAKKKAAPKRKAAKRKAAPKRKTAAKKKAAPKRKAAKKKAAPKRKAASKRKAAPKRKAAKRKR